MPNSSSSLVRIVLKRNAVKNAPKLSIRKILFGLEASLWSRDRNVFGINVNYRYLVSSAHFFTLYYFAACTNGESIGEVTVYMHCFSFAAFCRRL